ncbi:hypothetical protein DFJ43DRAFT_1072789 [Lentinula guzmanii]|uniref:Uncharacterized protein n=1 Tax=Lentinula guzmanii TaxID=2804957 RepID=A0AA38JA72_9AGAR|nr:hypothetical protein DFJ43DRAFT_1072789 [Lentinula guzmanii]
MLLAWLLAFLPFIIRTVSSVNVNGPKSTGPPGTVSNEATATWILQDGDASLSSGFSMVLVNDNAGVTTEWSTIVSPQGQSTGTVHFTPSVAGPHRVEVIPFGSETDKGSSSEFTVLQNNGSNSSDHNPSVPSVPSGPGDSSLPTSDTTGSFHSSSSPSVTSSRYSPTSTPTTTTATSPPRTGFDEYSVAIVLCAIFGTVLLGFLLLAVILLLRRRRRLRFSANQIRPARHHSERFHWSSPQTASGSSTDVSSELFETSKTAPMSVLNAPESWDTSSIAPSDSVSRLLSLKRFEGRQLERHHFSPADRSRNKRSIVDWSDVGTDIVEETNWVHAGGPELIPQIRRNR